MTNVICIACPPGTEIAGDKYKEHLKLVHGSESTQGAILNEKTKKQNIPADIPTSALPTKEFMEAVKRIEQKETQPVQQPIIPTIKTPPNPTVAPENAIKKPITLRYKFEGDCPTCGNQVKTIMVTARRSLIAMCYCAFCDKEVKQMIVHPIEETREEAKTNGHHSSEKTVSGKKALRSVPQATA